MPRNVIIVGPPRSGTSLASDIFARQGYCTGEGLRQGDDYNPFGYYEAEDLIDANVELFQAVGYEHHNTWKFSVIEQSQVSAINELSARPQHLALVDEWNRRTPWMWKDPRFAITLGYWARLIDWQTTGVVLTIRDPEDVYWSFRRKGWCGVGIAAHDAAIKLIEMHAANARRLVDELSLPYIAIEYGEYHADPAGVARRIADFTGLTLTAADLNFHAELDHSTGSSRLAGHIRIVLKKLPRGPLQRLARLLPERLKCLLLPERRFVPTELPAANSSAANSPDIHSPPVQTVALPFNNHPKSDRPPSEQPPDYRRVA